MIAFNEYLGEFNPIGLEETDSVRLMNRRDTKYIFRAGLLPGILEQATGNYRILTIGETSLFRYNTRYYDTVDLKLYLDHHNRSRPRFKVRFREYADTGDVFLEIKVKTNNNRTIKERKKVKEVETRLSTENRRYIDQRIPGFNSPLKPSLWSHFHRATLVGIHTQERITIDTGISFSSGGQEKQLPGMVICEVKRDANASQFMSLLKQNFVHPEKLSKYCLGAVLLKDPVKTNRFKPVLLKINKLENEYNDFAVAG